MGLFDIFKRNAVNIVSTPSSSKFTDSEIAFLQYSDGHDTDIDTFSKHFSYDYDLDYKKTLQKLMDSNLLSISTAEESLNIYTVNELKTYLKQKGLSTTGKKDILIDRIITQTTDYATFFTKRTYSVTDAGKLMIDDYNNRKAKRIQDIVFTTISSIRSGDLDTIYPLFESNGPFKNPLAIPYDKNSIKKDVTAINQYRSLNHDTDRELASCIVSIMMNKTFKDTINMMKILGYDDVCESEMHTAFSSITSLRQIADFRETTVKNTKSLHVKMNESATNAKRWMKKFYQCLKRNSEKAFLHSVINADAALSLFFNEEINTPAF